MSEQQAGVHPMWKWLAVGLAVVLIAGTVGVLIWQSSDDELASGFPIGTFWAPSGVEAMEFNEDGTCLNFHEVDGWELPCKYAVNGDLYTEMWFDWPDGPKFPATYFWDYDEDAGTLSFELWGEDDNEFRRAFYTNGLSEAKAG